MAGVGFARILPSVQSPGAATVSLRHIVENHRVYPRYPSSAGRGRHARAVPAAPATTHLADAGQASNSAVALNATAPVSSSAHSFALRPSAEGSPHRVIGRSTNSGLTLRDGKIATDAEGTTNLKGVWAGGDCRAGGLDLTVEAVEHGKQSANAIHAFLKA